VLPWPTPSPILVLNVVSGKLVPNPSCVLNLKLLASTVAEISRGSQNFVGCSPGPHPANFGPKRRFWQASQNPICVPNLKLLASTVAKIRRGSHIFGCSPGPHPRQFLSKTLFFGKLVPNPSCVPNLKLLASTVEKILRGSQFFLDAPLAQTPANFGPKRCFWQATPRTQVV